MFTHHRTDGIVLARKEKGEADEVLTLFTKDFGKVEVVGRSIRKGGSKLRMSMSLFSHVEISFIEGKAYNTLTDARTIQDPKDAKEDLKKLSFLYRISELTLLLLKGPQEEERILSLLLSTIEEVDKKDLSREELKLLFCLFSFRILYFLGYKLYTEKCVFCGSAIEKECIFDPKEGGVACKKCSRSAFSGIRLHKVTLLRDLFSANSAPSEKDVDTLLHALENYLSFIPEAKGKRFIH